MCLVVKTLYTSSACDLIINNNINCFRFDILSQTFFLSISKISNLKLIQDKIKIPQNE